MADFWEDFRNKVLAQTTAADTANMIYAKVASTGVMGPAVTKPAYHLGHMSNLTMDFIDHVERLLNTADDNRAAVLRSTTFLRECARSMVVEIQQAADPTERLITMLEDILETEELAAMEDADLDEGDESDEDSGADDEEDIDREALQPQRERLQEALRVKFRSGDYSESMTSELADSIGGIYLECVQFARELARLSRAPEEDTSTIMSILMDLQYSLDTQLRALLMEDVDTSDLEPSFHIGFFTWSSHFVAEIMEKIHAEKTPTPLTI